MSVTSSNGDYEVLCNEGKHRHLKFLPTITNKCQKPQNQPSNVEGIT